MGTIACSVDKVSAIPVLPVEHKEASLIRQIFGGRRDLFGDLIEPHVGALWRTVQAKMRNDPDIDDIVQQAVFKAFTHLEQFRFEAGFRTWLIRIALNEVNEHWRKRHTSRSVARRVGDRPNTGRGPEAPPSMCALAARPPGCFGLHLPVYQGSESVYREFHRTHRMIITSFKRFWLNHALPDPL